MTVLTIVTDAFKASARPLRGVIAAFPAVEKLVAADEMIVPTMVPPPAPLIVAALPTCQNTFFGCAPPARITLRGAPAAPTVSVLAIWNTQTALALPPPSRVRSDPVRRNPPDAA